MGCHSLCFIGAWHGLVSSTWKSRDCLGYEGKKLASTTHRSREGEVNAMCSTFQRQSLLNTSISLRCTEPNCKSTCYLFKLLLLNDPSLARERDSFGCRLKFACSGCLVLSRTTVAFFGSYDIDLLIDNFLAFLAIRFSMQMEMHRDLVYFPASMFQHVRCPLCARERARHRRDPGQTFEAHEIFVGKFWNLDGCQACFTRSRSSTPTEGCGCGKWGDTVW